jgi:hypothetical protein
MGAAGVNSYTLVASDTTMPNLGNMAVLGDVTYG